MREKRCTGFFNIVLSKGLNTQYKASWSTLEAVHSSFFIVNKQISILYNGNQRVVRYSVQAEALESGEGNRKSSQGCVAPGANVAGAARDPYNGSLRMSRVTRMRNGGRIRNGRGTEHVSVWSHVARRSTLGLFHTESEFNRLISPYPYHLGFGIPYRPQWIYIWVYLALQCSCEANRARLVCHAHPQSAEHFDHRHWSRPGNSSHCLSMVAQA